MTPFLFAALIVAAYLSLKVQVLRLRRLWDGVLRQFDALAATLERRRRTLIEVSPRVRAELAGMGAPLESLDHAQRASREALTRARRAPADPVAREALLDAEAGFASGLRNLRRGTNSAPGFVRGGELDRLLSDLADLQTRLRRQARSLDGALKPYAARRARLPAALLAPIARLPRAAPLGLE